MTKTRTTNGVVQVGILYVLILRTVVFFSRNSWDGHLDLHKVRIGFEGLHAFYAQHDKHPDAKEHVSSDAAANSIRSVYLAPMIAVFPLKTPRSTNR